MGANRVRVQLRCPCFGAGDPTSQCFLVPPGRVELPTYGTGNRSLIYTDNSRTRKTAELRGSRTVHTGTQRKAPGTPSVPLAKEQDMTPTSQQAATQDPAPWRHTGGARVSDPYGAGSPEGGYTYDPRPGYSDFPERFVSARRTAGVRA